MRKRMKQLLLLGLAGCMAFTMAACGKKADSKDKETTQQETSAEDTTEQDNSTEDKNDTTGNEDESDMTYDKDNLPTEDLTMEETGEQQEEKKEEEALPTDENGVVIDCPKSVYSPRSDVTYGLVAHFKYYSNTTKSERGASVLLPGNYSTDKKYPVVYFQHGIFGNEYSMTSDSNNHVKEIFGNLAADGLAPEVIVVFPNMYASEDPNLQPGFTNEQMAPYDNFINDLINDLMPYVEEHYSVATGRENTAVIGFSMGGRESLYIGTQRSDLFAYVGAISPAPGLTPGQDWAMEHPGTLTEDELVIAKSDYPPTTLMVCCGTQDSVVGTFPKSYHEIMERNGVEHLWYEITGADHDNRAIRSGIYNFMIRWNMAE